MPVLEELSSRRRHSLRGAELTVGSDRGCQIVVSDPTVAPRHCQLSVESGRVMLADLGTGAPTLLNGHKVLMARVKDGDTIQVGEVAMVFRDAEPRDLAYAAAWALGGLGAVLLVASLAWAPIAGVIGAAGRGGEREPASTLPQLIPDEELNENLRPLPVVRQEQLAAATIRASEGGVVTGGELAISVPPGAFAGDRRVEIHRIAPMECPYEIGLLGSSERFRPQSLGSWEVDAGDSEGPYAADVEVAVDLASLGATGDQILIPAVSLDGATWTRLRGERRGDQLVFSTRHFCSVQLWGWTIQITGVSWVNILFGLKVGIPLAAAAYLIYDRANEFPTWAHEYEPFTALQPTPDGFEIWWSRKLKGVDPVSGLAPWTVEDFKADMEPLLRRHMAEAQSTDPDPGRWPAEVRHRFEKAFAELIKEHTVPEKVRTLEKALLEAQAYLKTRNIDPPFFDLPVYVVPSLHGKGAGYIHNPWSGRRYMLVAEDSADDVLKAVALHELFHHYQTGYVWIDRNGHLPFLEATALLMEREAKPAWVAKKETIDISEGLGLAQAVAMAHGLNGPSSGQEAWVRNFGYGLTWFVEYLRDRRSDTEQGRAAFQRELLDQWASTRYNANYKVLLWAAGGDEAKLRAALVDFARTKLLPGLEDQAGARTPYGRAYGSSLFEDKPYTEKATEGRTMSGDFGLPVTALDLATTPTHEVGDDRIRPWSIQFFKLQPAASPRSVALLQVPRTWFPSAEEGRVVFVRERPGQVEVDELRDVSLTPESCPMAATTLPLDDAAFVYVVDSGQSGSSWFGSLAAARIRRLDPPTEVKVTLKGEQAEVRWSPSPTATELTGYRVYVVGSSLPVAEVPVTRTTASFAAPGSTPRVMVAGVVELCRNGDGTPVVATTALSEPAGGEEPGRFELRLDVSPGVIKSGSECDRMNHRWNFQGFAVTVAVEVGPDGAFTFSKRWKDPDAGRESAYSITGRGSFVADKLSLRADFTSSASWTGSAYETEAGGTETDTFYQEARGELVGEGEFKQGIWFGHKLSGGYNATYTGRYCAGATNNVCRDWITESSECTGEIPRMVSSIESFTRVGTP